MVTVVEDGRLGFGGVCGRSGLPSVTELLTSAPPLDNGERPNPTEAAEPMNGKDLKGFVRS